MLDLDTLYSPILLLLVLICVLGWYGWKRHLLRSLLWDPATPSRQITRLCARYLKTYGIVSQIEDDDLVTLSIPGRQFPNRIGTFMLNCRNREYITGESLFMDMASMSRREHFGVTPVIVTTSPVTSDLTSHSLVHRVAIINTTELLPFAIALRAAMRGESYTYKGNSKLLERALLPPELRVTQNCDGSSARA